jgi:hypothetical protein
VLYQGGGTREGRALGIYHLAREMAHRQVDTRLAEFKAMLSEPLVIEQRIAAPVPSDWLSPEEEDGEDDATWTPLLPS